MLLKNKKFLVTGGAGFIGSNLAIKLIEDGAQVTILDALLPDCGGDLFNLKVVNGRYEFVKSEMQEVNELISIVEDKDFIFNLSGRISHVGSIDEPYLDWQSNSFAHLNLLEACLITKSNAKILFASTRQVYGKPLYLPLDEKHPVCPIDLNGVHKFAGEYYHKIYSQLFDLKTISLRLTNTYGPRLCIKNSKLGFINWFLNRALLDESISLFDSGLILRDFNYVDDVVDAMLLAVENNNCVGKVFNLGGEQATLRDIAEKLISLTAKGKIEIVQTPQEREKINLGNCYSSYELFKKITGWVPKIGLDKGLCETVKFFKSY